MRFFAFFLPVSLGILVVLQAGLNRTEALRLGFPGAVLANSLVFAIVAISFFLYSKSSIAFDGFQWWFLLPGVFGFCLVWGGAYAVLQWGAQHTFILIVASQLVTSLLWDVCVQKTTPSPAKLIGTALVWFGVWVAGR